MKHHSVAGSFFFGSGTGQDAVNSSLMIVELGAGRLELPDRDYYTKTDPKSIKIREQYAAYVAQLLGMSGERQRCCEPQRFVALQGAPVPAEITSA